MQLRKKTKTQADRVIAIEFKLGTRWRSEWAKALVALDENKKAIVVERLIVVYTGRLREQHGRIELIPAEEFLTGLHQGEIF